MTIVQSTPICISDIDECTANNPCGMDCNNTAGGFACSCNIGYSIGSDLVSCERES